VKWVLLNLNFSSVTLLVACKGIAINSLPVKDVQYNANTENQFHSFAQDRNDI
jgi:hypothetical protein